MLAGLFLIFYGLGDALGWGEGRASAAVWGRVHPDLGAGIAGCGALLHLWHYRILKRSVVRLDDPGALIRSGGLFGWVRHPMYLGDGLTMVGFFLLRMDLVAASVLAAGLALLVVQCRREDRQLALRFGTPYTDWQTRTRLLVPLIF